jgi:hypothetical protein
MMILGEELNSSWGWAEWLAQPNPWILGGIRRHQKLDGTPLDQPYAFGIVDDVLVDEEPNCVASAHAERSVLRALQLCSW